MLQKQSLRNQAFKQAPRTAPRAPLAVRCQAQRDTACAPAGQQLARSAAAVALAGVLALSQPAFALAEERKALCDAACESSLESVPMVTTASGLQYKEIAKGRGPAPPPGFLAVVDYIAMTPAGKVFDSSLDKGAPYEIRVGGGQVILGLDEALATMPTGSVRRLYIPGPLAFPKGLKAAAGRASVPPASPVMFDVKMVYIPGMDVDDE